MEGEKRDKERRDGERVDRERNRGKEEVWGEEREEEREGERERERERERSEGWREDGHIYGSLLSLWYSASQSPLGSVVL